MVAAASADASPNGFHDRARIMRIAVYCENCVVLIFIIDEAARNSFSGHYPQQDWVTATAPVTSIAGIYRQTIDAETPSQWVTSPSAVEKLRRSMIYEAFSIVVLTRFSIEK
jgi:hypothetical protein